jgi:hypothetical protein
VNTCRRGAPCWTSYGAKAASCWLRCETAANRVRGSLRYRTVRGEFAKLTCAPARNPGCCPVRARILGSLHPLIRRVGIERFERPSARSQSGCSTKLSYIPRPAQGNLCRMLLPHRPSDRLWRLRFWCRVRFLRFRRRTLGGFLGLTWHR